MKAIELLRGEHEMIGRMLDYLSASLAPFSQPNVHRATSFFSEWMIEIHHTKQEVLFEELLFRAPDVAAGVVQIMRKEHAVAEAYLEKMVELLKLDDNTSRDRLLRYCNAFIELMREHIVKEARTLFVMCEQLIAPSMDPVLQTRYVEQTAERLPMYALTAHLRIAENPNNTMVMRAKRTAPVASAPEQPTPAVAATPATLSGGVMDAKTLAGGADEEEDESFMSAKARWMLYDKDGHQNVRLHDFGQGLAVQANTFLIVNNGQGMLLDPGGPKVFPNVLAETMMLLEDGGLRWLFLSHQDPDICTALNAWLMDTKADALVSKLWTRFLPHFGIDRLMRSRLNAIGDDGMIVELGETELMILPAHFLHSCGNFQVYDPVSKVLFSGDLGASVGAEGSYVEDFEEHLKYMRGFHRRYMASNMALRAWADMVEKLDVEVIAPQHGLALKGQRTISRFLDWCRDLKCGADFANEMFQLPTTRTFVA